MEWTWKKTAAILVVFVLIFVTPVFLVSNTMMDYYHRKIDAEPETENSKWLTLKTANICVDTWRPKRAAEYYGKFVKRYPEDEQIPETKYWQARALEDCLKYSEAAEIYKSIQLDYPEDIKLVKKSKEGWARCKYGVGNK